MLLFGVGITLVVAPLTTTLMTSVPVANAGLASAINNAISRIGQPLLSAVIFVVVSGSFYAAVTVAVPSFDSNDPEQRALVQPLNPPQPGRVAGARRGVEGGVGRRPPPRGGRVRAAAARRGRRERDRAAAEAGRGRGAGRGIRRGPGAADAPGIG